MGVKFEKSVFQDLKRMGVPRVQRIYDSIINNGVSHYVSGKVFNFHDNEITLIGVVDENGDVKIEKIALDYVTDSAENCLTLREVEDYLNGVSLITIWRKKRGLTVTALAQKINRATGYISEIEHGKKTGTLEVIQEIANEMGLEIRDIT